MIFRTTWAWPIFGVLVLALLGTDLIVHRRGHADGWRGAVAWSIGWVALSLLVNLGVWHFMGAERAEEFLGAYLLEKSLSVDNLFIFLLIFGRFGVKPEHQHMVLSWGVFGAFVLRGIFIALGSALVQRSHFMLEIFGALLVFTANG